MLSTLKIQQEGFSAEGVVFFSSPLNGGRSPMVREVGFEPTLTKHKSLKLRTLYVP